MNEQNVNEKKTHGIPAQQEQDGNQGQAVDPMTPVNSSAFTGIHHDPKTNILTIQFNNGNKQRYHHFNADKYQEFIKADSLGKFFSEYIRNNPAYNESQREVA